MAKFIGILGIVTDHVEIYENGRPTSKYKPVIIEKSVTGDILNNSHNTVLDNGVNEGLNLNQRFSFLASPSILSPSPDASMKNYILYLEIWGIKWRVTNVEVSPPVITISTGGLWNG